MTNGTPETKGAIIERLSSYRDFSVEARRLGLRYGLLIEPTVYEKLYDLIVLAPEEPGDEHDVLARIVLSLRVLTGLKPDCCEYLFAPAIVSNGPQIPEVPMLATFHSDQHGDYFVVDFAADEDWNPTRMPRRRSRTSRGSENGGNSQ